MTPFPLQRILDLRTDRERTVATQLSRATDAATRAAASHEAAVAQQHAGSRQLESLARDGVDVGTITSLATAVAALMSRVELAESSRREAESGAEAIGVQMVAATKDRRMIERLRERHDLATRDADAARERSVMDAAALGRFITARSLATESE